MRFKSLLLLMVCLAACAVTMLSASQAQAQVHFYISDTVFTQKGTPNIPLTPLFNKQFDVYGTPQIWICDANNKGSLFTFDYTNVTDITIMIWSTPSATTKEYMVFRKIGSSWYTDQRTLPWETYHQ